jgi:5-methylcytosine-specific restriction protein A
LPRATNCIEHYGTNCYICGFNFEKKYGEIGRDFIHVHHIKPLSEIGKKYELNPIQDLRPVCPNCHAMLHRKKSPYSIDELNQIINNNWCQSEI